MKSVLFRHHLTVKKSSISGYGVFASKDISSGELLEECHIIPCQGSESALRNYLFSWGKDKKNYVLALGYGSIFNHSDQPNAEFFADIDHQLLLFKALRNIKSGEEIFIRYGSGDWFSARHIRKKKPYTIFHWVNPVTSLPMRLFIIFIICFLIILLWRHFAFT